MKYLWVVLLMIGLASLQSAPSSILAQGSENPVSSQCITVRDGRFFVKFIYPDFPGYPYPPGKVGGDIDEIPLNDFIIGTVEGEMFPISSDYPDNEEKFHIESLKAQAVAIRSFLLYKYRCQGNQFEIKFGTAAYWPNKQNANYEPLIGDFVRNNSFYLKVAGGPEYDPNETIALDAVYKAYTHQLDTDGLAHTIKYGSGYYVNAVYEPVMNGFPNSNPPPIEGLGQNAADVWARGKTTVPSNILRYYPKWTWKRILAHYYTNFDLVDFNGIPYADAYRWNLLDIQPQIAQKASDHGNGFEALKSRESSPRQIFLQNTGNFTFKHNTRVMVQWRRYAVNGTTTIEDETTFPMEVDVFRTNDPNFPTPPAPSQHRAFNVALTPPQGIFQGNNGYQYTLIWLLQHPDNFDDTNTFGAGWENDFFFERGWEAQELDIYIRSWIDEVVDILIPIVEDLPTDPEDENDPDPDPIETPQPDPDPVPPPCDPKCTWPQGEVAVHWDEPAHDASDLFYYWQHKHNGQIVTTGNTSDGVTHLTAHLAGYKGEHTFYIQAGEFAPTPLLNSWLVRCQRILRMTLLCHGEPRRFHPQLLLQTMLQRFMEPPTPSNSRPKIMQATPSLHENSYRLMLRLQCLQQHH